MKVIDRNIYMSKILSHLNRGVMIVLVGQRRVGKSYLLKSLDRWLKQNKPEANVLFINKEFHEFDFIKTPEDLYEAAVSHLPPENENYLLIDEVQDIEGYERALRSLYAEDRCQIVLTGSNAYLFSSELSTKLAGRYVEIPVRSLGYEEFLMFRGISDSHESLIQYLTFGGMPGLINYDFRDLPAVRNYLDDILNTVVVKDIMLREQIRNITFLERLIRFLADNAGQLVSVNSIVKYLKAQDKKYSNELVSRYISTICNALVVDEVPRYDIRGKKIFEQTGKYFFCDHGMRNCISNELTHIYGGIEKILENVVRNHLLIHGFSVFVGVLGSGEIDFVAQKGEQTVYIQVAYKLGDDKTVAREFGNLLKIKDNYPKYVVTMEDLVGPLPQYPGIFHIHLREFLRTDFS